MQAQQRGGEMALTSGGVSTAACSILLTHGLTLKQHCLLSATAWLPPSRQEQTWTSLAVDYDRNKFTTAAGLPVISCSSPWGSVLNQPHKALAAHWRPGLHLCLECTLDSSDFRLAPGSTGLGLTLQPNRRSPCFETFCLFQAPHHQLEDMG